MSHDEQKPQPVMWNLVLHSSYVACMHFSDLACLSSVCAKGGLCYQF